jgi:hypothetical protein
MYLYFDRLGVLKEIINDEALRQGNYNVNKLYIYCERNGIVRLDVSYLLPSSLVVGPTSFNKTETAEIPYDKKRDLYYFKYHKEYTFFVVDLEADSNGHGPLDQAGLVHCSISAVLPRGILTLGAVNFMVELDSVYNQYYVAQQEYMSLSDYRYLEYLVNLSNFENYQPLYSITPTAWDTEPIKASTKPVTSGGIYNFIVLNYLNERDSRATFVPFSSANENAKHDFTLNDSYLSLSYTNLSISKTATIKLSDSGVNITGDHLKFNGNTVAMADQILHYYQHNIVIRTEADVFSTSIMTDRLEPYDDTEFLDLIVGMATNDGGGSKVLTGNGYLLGGYRAFYMTVTSSNTATALCEFNGVIESVDVTSFWTTHSLVDSVISVELL